jgi:N-methylhydantoinase A
MNGNKISGAAIVEEPTTTLVVAPNYELTCDSYNNYLLYHKGDNLEEIIRKFVK